jgi:hypothetical protein
MNVSRAILRISARHRRLRDLIKTAAAPDPAQLKRDATILKNHVIRINKRAQEVYNYLAQLNVGEAKAHANTLRNLAVRLTGQIMNPKPDKKTITDTYNLLTGEFETIRNNFLPKAWIDQWDYAPMKEIRDSLAFVNRYLVGPNIDLILGMTVQAGQNYSSLLLPSRF